MRNTSGRKSSSKTAKQMESELEDRQDMRREKERDQGQDLLQRTQTGTHDSERLGVNWPPSYRTLKKRKPAAKRSK